MLCGLVIVVVIIPAKANWYLVDTKDNKAGYFEEKPTRGNDYMNMLGRRNKALQACTRGCYEDFGTGCKTTCMDPEDKCLDKCLESNCFQKCIDRANECREKMDDACSKRQKLEDQCNERKCSKFREGPNPGRPVSFDAQIFRARSLYKPAPMP